MAILALKRNVTVRGVLGFDRFLNTRSSKRTPDNRRSEKARGFPDELLIGYRRTISIQTKPI